MAAGGFESNLEWLREAWGQNENGEWPADNFIIRGTRFNQGNLLKFMIDQGADIIGDPSQSHCVAVDAKSTVMTVVFVLVLTAFPWELWSTKLNVFTMKAKTSGKTYAIWGRLVAKQPQQIAYSIIDSKAIGRFMPPVFAGVKANSIQELAEKSGWMQNLMPYRRRI